MLLVWNVNVHLGAVHKVHHAIFGQFSILLPLSDFVTHPGTPKSTSHISDLPILVGLISSVVSTGPNSLYRASLALRWLSDLHITLHWLPDVVMPIVWLP